MDVETGACYRWKVKCYWTGSFRLLWPSFAAPRSDIYPSHLGPSRSTGRIVIYRRCRHALSLPTVSPRATVAVFGDKERTVETSRVRGSATREYVDYARSYRRDLSNSVISCSFHDGCENEERFSRFFPSSSFLLFLFIFFFYRESRDVPLVSLGGFSFPKFLRRLKKRGRICRVRARRTIAN